jgi:hypothetical protein
MDSTFIDRALGSNVPYITYAVPCFFLLIGVELVVALWEHTFLTIAAGRCRRSYCESPRPLQRSPAGCRTGRG